MTTILTGDCRELLKTLPDASVNCCVTSPPYWGLRDYGTAKWDGSSAECEHSVGGQVQDNKAPGAITTGQRPGVDPSTCRKCGARRIDAQMGLEETPEAYVAGMVAVFREVRRVLRDDGTLWLNVGDSYANTGGHVGHSETSQRHGRANLEAQNAVKGSIPTGLKPKDLVGIPWRVAFALQADGWYLRQDIIWHKPNPMPESVTDRCTKAHEYIFLLSKSPRYYYDADEIKEPWTCTRDDMRTKGVRTGLGYLQQCPVASNSVKSKRPDGWASHKGGHGSFHKAGREHGDTAVLDPTTGRNKRSVWTVATQPYSGAHFATFPPKLIEPCILAGCPQGGTVLDPFGGSGTTGEVAEANGRNSILIELNQQYVDLAHKRTAQMGLFCSPAAAVRAFM